MNLFKKKSNDNPSDDPKNPKTDKEVSGSNSSETKNSTNDRQFSEEELARHAEAADRGFDLDEMMKRAEAGDRQAAELVAMIGSGDAFVSESGQLEIRIDPAKLHAAHAQLIQTVCRKTNGYLGWTVEPEPAEADQMARLLEIVFLKRVGLVAVENPEIALIGNLVTSWVGPNVIMSLMAPEASEQETVN